MDGIGYHFSHSFAFHGQKRPTLFYFFTTTTTIAIITKSKPIMKLQSSPPIPKPSLPLQAQRKSWKSFTPPDQGEKERNAIKSKATKRSKLHSYHSNSIRPEITSNKTWKKNLDEEKHVRVRVLREPYP
jgi:hypothetical protein